MYLEEDKHQCSHSKMDYELWDFKINRHTQAVHKNSTPQILAINSSIGRGKKIVAGYELFSVDLQG